MISANNGIIYCRIDAFKNKFDEIIKYLTDKHSEISEDEYPDCEDSFRYLLNLLDMDVVSSDIVENNCIFYSVSVNTNDVNRLTSDLEFLLDVGVIQSLHISLWEDRFSGEIIYITGTNKDDIKIPIKVRNEYLKFFKYNVSGNICYVYIYNNHFVEVNEKKNGLIDIEDIKTGKIVDEQAGDMYENIRDPWDSSAISFNIYTNNFGQWVCEQNVIVYDSIEVSIYGYGSTPEKAIENSRERIKWLKYHQF